MVSGRRVPGREGLADQRVDGRAVLGVNADEAADLRGPSQHAEDPVVVQHQAAGVGHEELERGHPLGHERRHFGFDVGAEVRNADVEPEVDDGLPGGARHPLVERLAERSALGLRRVVDDGRRPAARGGHRAGGEVVSGADVAERHIEVRVNIDAARQQQAARRVDHAVDGLGEAGADRGNALAIHQDVGALLSVGVDDGSVAQEGTHGREDYTERGATCDRAILRSCELNTAL